MVRFDKPCHHLAGAIRYFSEHLAKADYLSEGGQAPLLWIGAGAEKLGLSGIVEIDHFERLCKGHHPFTGQKLTVRDKGNARRICYFGQISPPKDVSIAYLVGGDARIGKWWEEAVQETLREMESATATRIRKNNQTSYRETANMIAAVVTHDASRSLDPQLHTHVCVMNVTFDPVEERWKSVEPIGYFEHQGYFREVCYNHLAKRMQEAGYELEKVRKIGFTIRGFPTELRKRFSKRREEILEFARERGVTSQDGLHEIAGSSRAAKKTLQPDELKIRWRREAGEELATVQAVITEANGTPKPTKPISVEEAIAHAEAHLFERVSVTEERIFLREALIFGRGYFDLETLKRGLETRIASNNLIRKGTQITSREMLRLERAFVSWAIYGRNQCERMGDASELSPSLSKEQRIAVRHTLDSRNQVVGLEGNAGTGKTTVLKEIVRGIERNGQTPFACAPSSGATKVLQKELTPEADTLQQLLVNPGLQRKVTGRTIIVDEAGLISTRQMHALFELAQRNQNRLLLVGDIKQHASVEAGDAFRALKKFARIDVATLKTIRRQVNPGYRKVVALLAKRKPYDAFNQLERLGEVRQIPEPAMLFAQAAQDYVETLKKGQSCLAISPVWSDIHQFNQVIRSLLKQEGMLQTEEQTLTAFIPFQWTKAERKDARNYQVGDVLQFHRQSAIFEKGEMVRFIERQERRIVVERANGERFAFHPGQITGFDTGLDQAVPVAVGEKLLIRANHAPSRLQNGDIVEVAAFDANGSLLLKDGRILPSAFRQFAHGYAATSHASQGKTIDRGIGILSDEAIQAANLRQAYVSNSRFRLTQTLYVSDRKAARNAMATPAERELAMEMATQQFRRWKICEKIIELDEAFQARRQRKAIQQTLKQEMTHGS